MLAAPLMIGCGLSGRRHDDPVVVALRDPELIALDQHPQVRSARLVGLADGLDCYEREVDSELAFVVVNTSSDPRTVPSPRCGRARVRTASWSTAPTPTRAWRRWTCPPAAQRSCAPTSEAATGGVRTWTRPGPHPARRGESGPRVCVREDAGVTCARQW